MSTALATTFAGSHAGERVRAALEAAQPSGVVLDDALAPAVYEVLSAAMDGGLRALAVEAPCPRTRASSAELCALDRDEASTAVQVAVATIERAGALGAAFVVVRLGAPRPFESRWVRARERFLRGELDPDDASALLLGRERESERALDGARRALEELVRSAETAGVVLCLKNPRRYIELPSASELDALLREYRGAPVSPLFDVAGAHLQDVMGFEPLALTLAAFGANAPFAYAGDACGPVGALAPGRGIVDLAAVDAGLGKDTVRAFRPWRGLTVDEALESFARF